MSACAEAFPDQTIPCARAEPVRALRVRRRIAGSIAISLSFCFVQPAHAQQGSSAPVLLGQQIQRFIDLRCQAAAGLSDEPGLERLEGQLAQERARREAAAKSAHSEWQERRREADEQQWQYDRAAVALAVALAKQGGAPVGPDEEAAAKRASETVYEIAWREGLAKKVADLQAALRQAASAESGGYDRELRSRATIERDLQAARAGVDAANRGTPLAALRKELVKHRQARQSARVQRMGSAADEIERLENDMRAALVRHHRIVADKEDKRRALLSAISAMRLYPLYASGVRPCIDARRQALRAGAGAPAPQAQGDGARPPAQVQATLAVRLAASLGGTVTAVTFAAETLRMRQVMGEIDEGTRKQTLARLIEAWRTSIPEIEELRRERSDAAQRLFNTIMAAAAGARWPADRSAAEQRELAAVYIESTRPRLAYGVAAQASLIDALRPIAEVSGWLRGSAGREAIFDGVDEEIQTAVDELMAGIRL